MEEKKRKPLNKKWIALACLIVAVVYFVTCPMMRTSTSEVTRGECISISLFGKLELRDIDRVEIIGYAEQVTITDQELIRQITNETRIATYVRSDCWKPAHCSDPHRQIELYRGDQMVRSMDWDACCDRVYVYERDLTHWLIPWWCDYEGGYVSLSNELIERLNALGGL